MSEQPLQTGLGKQEFFATCTGSLSSNDSTGKRYFDCGG